MLYVAIKLLDCDYMMPLGYLYIRIYFLNLKF